MITVYVRNIQNRKEPNGFRFIDVDFVKERERACHWETKLEAANEAGALQYHDIRITTEDRQIHIVKGYRVEERELGHFIISVEVPSLLTTGSKLNCQRLID